MLFIVAVIYISKKFLKGGTGPLGPPKSAPAKVIIIIINCSSEYIFKWTEDVWFKVPQFTDKYIHVNLLVCYGN